MAYRAIKPCKFAGHKFLIGDEIPAEFIQPGAVKNLLKMGLIAMQADGESAPVAEAASATIAEFSITVATKQGKMTLHLTPESIQTVFDVLTGTAVDAESTIADISDGDALILIHLTDPRKTVKELAATRAKEISV